MKIIIITIIITTIIIIIIIIIIIKRDSSQICVQNVNGQKYKWAVGAYGPERQERKAQPNHILGPFTSGWSDIFTDVPAYRTGGGKP